jgi:hypothetical protein
MRRPRSVLEVAALPERLVQKARRGLEHPSAALALSATALGVAGLAALAYTLTESSGGPSSGGPSSGGPSSGGPSSGGPSSGGPSSGADSGSAVIVEKMSVLYATGLDSAVIVDPAGLHFIQGAPIKDAKGASGAIYQRLGPNYAFPADVKKKVTAVTMAAFHEYGTKHVIHVASPDLTGKKYAEALGLLTNAYTNVFAEFDLKGGGRMLRLLPLSSGKFVGKFKSQIHDLTALAFYAAGGASVRNLVLCTHTDDPKPYIAALAKFAPQGQTFRDALDVLTLAYKAAISARVLLPPSDQVKGLTYAKFMSDLEARAMNEARPASTTRAVTYLKIQPSTAQARFPMLAVAVTEIGDAVAVCAGRTNAGKKVGLMVAGNSGRPAGDVGDDDRVAGKTEPCDTVHWDHKTQEESVVSSWMFGECGLVPSCDEMGALFRRTIAARWGMKRARTTDAQDYETIQGVDYTKATPEDYGDAWVVRRAMLLVPGTRAKTTATLVFVSGPNVGDGGTATGSMQRTRNATMAKVYGLFREGVKCAVRAGLDAMIREGVDVALVARVSCGIYAGKKGSDFHTNINDEFLILVNELLKETLGTTNRGNCFESVLVPVLPVAVTRFV